MNYAIVVPWHNPEQRARFLQAWNVPEDKIPDYLLLQQDSDHSGCGITKNRGIQRAMEAGTEVVIVLDDDCFPEEYKCLLPSCFGPPLEVFADFHLQALQPQQVPLLEVTTSPQARGNPYHTKTVAVPVAASLGFWTDIPDRDAVRQLADGATAPMLYERSVVFGRAAMLCGMNIAFRPADWWPWCSFLPHSRFDDVFMSWLWCREAYRRKACFNFNGPLVKHSRQSNVWANLRDEAKYLEANEHLWHEIFMHPSDDYETLKGLLPNYP